MSTLQDVIDLARIDLNDADKVRWPDTDLLKHGNAALRQAFQMRPDLRFGNYATAFTDLALSGTFPISDNYQRAVADYIIARAQAVDSDETDLSRTQTYMAAFAAQLGVS